MNFFPDSQEQLRSESLLLFHRHYPNEWEYKCVDKKTDFKTEVMMVHHVEDFSQLNDCVVKITKQYRKKFQ